MRDAIGEIGYFKQLGILDAVGIELLTALHYFHSTW